MQNSTISSSKIWLLSLGFMAISLIWTIYDVFVPVFLQNGRPDFETKSYVQGYGLNVVQMGFIMTWDNLAALLIMPYIGILSDRLRSRWGKRKPFIAFGVPLAALGFISIPLVLTYPIHFFILALLLTLISMDVFRTPSVALMPDMVSPSQQAQANGVINLMGCVGGILAAKGGEILYNISVPFPFYFGAIVMVLSYAILLIFVPESENKFAVSNDESVSIRDSFQQAVRLIQESSLSLRFLLGAIFFWFLGFNGITQLFSSLVVKEFDLELSKTSGLLAFPVVTILLCAIPSGIMGDRWGRKPVVLVSSILLSAILLALFFVQSLNQFKIGLIFLGAAWCFITVNSFPMVMKHASEFRIGAFTALYYLANQLSAVISPILFNGVVYIFNNNYRLGLLCASISIFLSFFLVLKIKGHDLDSEDQTISEPNRSYHL